MAAAPFLCQLWSPRWLRAGLTSSLSAKKPATSVGRGLESRLAEGVFLPPGWTPGYGALRLWFASLHHEQPEVEPQFRHL